MFSSLAAAADRSIFINHRRQKTDHSPTHTPHPPALTRFPTIKTSRFGDDYYVAHLLRCVSWLRMPPSIPYLEVPGDRATLVSALEEQVRGCLAYSLVRPSPTHPSLSIDTY